MADYLPKFKPGTAITRLANAAITGGQLVTAGGLVAGAGSADWLGVASHDVPTGGLFGVYSEGVQRLTASGAIAVGARVKAAANGQITTYTAGTDAADTLVGIALDAATTAGDVIAVKLAR